MCLKYLDQLTSNEVETFHFVKFIDQIIYCFHEQSKVEQSNTPPVFSAEKRQKRCNKVEKKKKD